MLAFRQSSHTTRCHNGDRDVRRAVRVRGQRASEPMRFFDRGGYLNNDELW